MHNHVIDNSKILAKQISERKAYTLKRKQDEAYARSVNDSRLREYIATRDSAIKAGLINPTTKG
jgi:hypothetical protein